MSQGGRPTGRRVLLRAAQVVVSFAVVGLLFAQVLPRVTGTDGHAIWQHLSRLSVPALVALVVVWMAGLWAYTWVLTGSLPGLTHAQALTLNLAGSAVSNLVSFGGAVGIGVTFAMAGSWGFGAGAITASTLVSGAWNVLAKLALPLVALVGLLVAGEIADRRIVVAAAVAAALLTVAVAAVVGALSSERVASVVSVVVERIGTWSLRVVRSDRQVHWDKAVLDFRHRTVGLLRSGAISMSAGMVGYAVLQAVLAWMCFRAVGSTLTAPEVFAGYALGRLLTSVVITPSGVGISELGSAALLTTFGASPASTTAGVLLFSLFTYLIEIPVGALGWLAWALYTPWRRDISPA